MRKRGFFLPPPRAGAITLHTPAQNEPLLPPPPLRGPAAAHRVPAPPEKPPPRPPARPAGFGPVRPCAAGATPPPGNGLPAPPRPPQARRARPNAPPRFSAAPPPNVRPACARRKPPPRPAPCACRKDAARATRGLAARPRVCPPPQGSDRTAPGCARARPPRRLACAPKGGSNPRARFAGDRGPLSRKFSRNSGPGV